ncbi:MAG TPA: hypothetical protein VEB59_12040 [Gemmatimonadales bacterium]|nr:hypothetical protein [Gemmatimonadales bacterium]
MQSREHVSRISAPVLGNTIRHQREPKAHMRYEPTVVYMLAEQARSSGVNLERVPGPWRPAERALPRPGRKSLEVIPIITNEHTEVMVDTKEHAIDVAGLLNWCGVHELNPVPEISVAEGRSADRTGPAGH